MEYESRQVKWYWLALFVLFCSGVVYLLFSGNPYLYSHLELRSALLVGDSSVRQTVPTHPALPAKLGAPTFAARYNLQRTAIDPLNAPRSRTYEEYAHYPVDFGDLAPELVHVTSDETGFYVSGKGPWAAAVDLEGKIRWKYKFKELAADRSLTPVLLDEESAYAIHPSGRVVALEKANGRLRWMMDLRQEVVATPMIWQKNLLIPVKSGEGVRFIIVHRSDGQLEGPSALLKLKPGFLLSYNASDASFIATVDNKVVAIDPEDWSAIWSQTLTDPIKGPAMIVENTLFVSTLGAKIVKLDAAKKGKVDWEADLEKPAVSAPAYLPIMHRLSVLDSTGALVALDAKTGKSLWRMAIENRNPLVETWSARLKGLNIEEFKMDWLHKGWAIWSPCSEKRFCMYTPGKGQQIARVSLSGAPMTLPLVLDKRLAFFGQGKPGHYVVSLVADENDLKRLRAQK